jgi:hypothetical protein
MSAVPLRRNRDFMLLEMGRLLSSTGTQLTGRTSSGRESCSRSSSSAGGKGCRAARWARSLRHSVPACWTASILPTALAIPSTDSVVHGYRIAMTPDRLLGRAESVRSTISLLIAPLGPLAAGVLLGSVSERATIAVFAAFALVLAVWGTLSPSIRTAPGLDELEGA